MNPDDRWDNPVIEVRRSARRKRTVSAYLKDGVVVVMIPAAASKADEEEYIALMVAKLRRNAQRRTPSDTGLLERAQRLNEQYLDGQAVPASVRWVDNMTTRWASCTTQTREIRVSCQVKSMPTWVLDYVLVHELSHILVPGHGSDFKALVNRYPRTEAAQAFLQGVTHGANLPKTFSDDF